MPDEATTTEDEDARELLDIDVGEVSMVDAPAIRRKFVMVKRAISTPTPTPTGETVDENEIIAADSDVAKALFPMLTALANEKMSALVEKVAAIQTALAAGTLKKKEVREMFSGLSSLLWGVEDDVIAISKSAGTPVEPVNKAKRMTARRIGELKAAHDQITSLLSELEDEVMADTTEKNEPGAVTADLTKAITAAVEGGLTAGLAPVTKSIEDIGTRLDGIDTRVKKVEDAVAAAAVAAAAAPVGTTITDTKKAEEAAAAAAAATAAAAIAAAGQSDVAKAITAALAPMTKTLGDIGQRLDTIESTPGSGGDDDAAAVAAAAAAKVEIEKAGSSAFWASAGVSPQA